MIREIKLASGELRYGIEVRVDGTKRYGFAKSRVEAERIEEDLMSQRGKTISTAVDAFLSAVWVPGFVVSAECREAI